MPAPWSRDAPLSSSDLGCDGSVSLGLFVLIGFVLGDLAGDAVTGGALGCWCMAGS